MDYESKPVSDYGVSLVTACQRVGHHNINTATELWLRPLDHTHSQGQIPMASDFTRDGRTPGHPFPIRRERLLPADCRSAKLLGATLLLLSV